MIKANFFTRDNINIGFKVSGHAGYAEYGQDIVCAAVTSTVMLTVNAITEIVKSPIELEQNDGEIKLILLDGNCEAVLFLDALMLHIKTLSEDYPENVKLVIMEV